MLPDPKEVQRIIDAALAEDIGKGDITAELLIPADKTARMHFVCREPMIVAGIPVAKQVFRTLDPVTSFQGTVLDGEEVPAQTLLLTVEGNARTILTGERTALNLMQRMSSVATLTGKYLTAIKGTDATLLDTRKTMPGLRILDKYAVRMAGAQNHRMRLDDGILIKDNHIAVLGSVTEAVNRAKAGAPTGLLVEIECDTLDQVREALEAGADIVLLDNMPVSMLKEAVLLNGGRAKLEASGGVSLETIRSIAETGVDYISVGRITHSVPSVDIGLDIEWLP